MFFTRVFGFTALTFLLSTSASPVPVETSSRGIDLAPISTPSVAVSPPSPRAATPDPQTSTPAWRIRSEPVKPDGVNNNPDWRRDFD
ncbi:hypothetical protein CVT26_004678 [Gymnopilus dilepis]|uniref:Uncharacterized protein n=1 Tax=Gymnopilus dilepis TaxID=231916 RepID=A0A409XZB6_9AGAR|nr:hypothetical protein CVT26_004678 [Gymnopilus dilepis]